MVHGTWYHGTITSFYNDLLCVTGLYGHGLSVPSRQGCPKNLRNLIPGAIFWGQFCFANLRNTVSIMIPLCQKWNFEGALWQKFSILTWDVWYLTFDKWLLTFKHLNIWNFEHLNIWTSEHLNIWLSEHLNIWTFESWNIRILNIWAFEHLKI